MRGKTKEGKEVLVEDFLGNIFINQDTYTHILFPLSFPLPFFSPSPSFSDGYNWLKENTPEDARILSWWDYGYQINGIANRTTLADGNTWNHEHIALIGKIMVTPEVKNLLKNV